MLKPKKKNYEFESKLDFKVQNYILVINLRFFFLLNRDQNQKKKNLLKFDLKLILSAVDYY